MKINYNSIAEQYSQHRKIHPGVLRGLLEETPLTDAHSILEVGCGTGNYILAMQSAADCRCFGIDPSEQMLSIACSRGEGVHFQTGEAQRLPFEDAAFDLVFSVDVIHHVNDKAQFIWEAERILKPGGMLCTVTNDETLIRARVPLSSYFPETVAYELARYPRIGDLVEWMHAAGFTGIKQEVVRLPYEITDPRPFEDKAFSSLHLIPDAALQAGLALMRADLAQGPIAAVSHYLLLWGSKPAG